MPFKWPDTLGADAASLFAAFLAHSTDTCCLVVSAEGTIVSCNNAFNALVDQRQAGAVGLPVADFLTAPDAASIGRWAGAGREPRSSPILLNFLGLNGMPFTRRCHIDSHGGQLVIIGEPDRGADAAMQLLLIDLNNRLTVAVRENARQKRELEQTHWHLKKIGELLPICVQCGRVDTGAATWEELHTFLQDQGGFLSHGYCPACAATLAQTWGFK
ncbi:MAG: PAS domain-containing protein [Acidobacteriota bacterium]